MTGHLSKNMDDGEDSQCTPSHHREYHREPGSSSEKIRNETPRGLVGIGGCSLSDFDSTRYDCPDNYVFSPHKWEPPRYNYSENYVSSTLKREPSLYSINSAVRDLHQFTISGTADHLEQAHNGKASAGQSSGAAAGIKSSKPSIGDSQLSLVQKLSKMEVESSAAAKQDIKSIQKPNKLKPPKLEGLTNIKTESDEARHTEYTYPRMGNMVFGKEEAKTSIIKTETDYLGLGSWPSDHVLDGEERPNSGGRIPYSEDAFSGLFPSSNTEINEHGSGSRTSESKQAGTSANPGGTSRPPYRRSGSSKNPKPPSGDGGNGNDENGEDGNNPRKRKQDSTPSKRVGKRFACPFHKEDPEQYRTNNETGDRYMTCGAGRGFPDIARLKEHLYRTHKLPLSCINCGLTFHDVTTLQHHLLETVRCDPKPAKPSKGITPEMAAELKSKKTFGRTPSETWYFIYQLVLPGKPIPNSPYNDNEDCFSTQFEGEENMANFLQREMSRRLTEKFDEEAVEDESLKDTLIFHVRTILKELCDHYTERQGVNALPLSEGSGTRTQFTNSFSLGQSALTHAQTEAQYLPDSLRPSRKRVPSGTDSSMDVPSSSPSSQLRFPPTPNNTGVMDPTITCRSSSPVRQVLHYTDSLSGHCGQCGQLFGFGDCEDCQSASKPPPSKPSLLNNFPAYPSSMASQAFSSHGLNPSIFEQSSTGFVPSTPAPEMSPPSENTPYSGYFYPDIFFSQDSRPE